MVVTLTVQSKNYRDVATSYSMGFEGSKIVNYFTKPTADTGYTATSVVVYNTEDGVQDVFGVSQSIATIANAVAAPSQLEIDNIETAAGLAVDGTYSAPTGTNFLDSTTSTLGAAVALDTKLGANATPVTRTNNPIVGTGTVHANIDKLDAAIGADADLTPVTRTVGQVTVDSTVMAKVEALDTVIGFDAQMSGTPTLISKSQTIYQNLEALATYKNGRTIKKTIGWPSATGTDFVFTSAANHTAQNLDLGAIIPAKARVSAIEIVCTEALISSAGASDITLRAGNASGGEQFIASASCDDLNEVVGIIDATKPAAVVMNWASATNIWIGGDPDQNWDSLTAGKWTVYITFNEYTNV